MKILKSIGEYEEYSREKLMKSLLNASASVVVSNEIIKKVETLIHDQMSSTEIYNIAIDLLNQKEKITAMKYSVKRSIFDLGPTGFPFEKFVARLFAAKGYKTKVGKILLGNCIEHEVDIVAYDENELILMEVKFHNSTSLKTDTKVALYIKARWDDLKNVPIKLDDGRVMLPTRGILTTNTEFTTNAIDYAKCADLGMISWNYPQKGNLFALVRETGQHPITVISEFSNKQKIDLIKEGFITINQIVANPKILEKLGLSNEEIQVVIDESKKVCEIC